jgi:hypothetical protein
MSDTRLASSSPLAAASLIGAPTLMLVSALVQPSLESDESLQLRVILAHHGRYFWFTLLLLLGTMLLVPAFHALRGPSVMTKLGSALAVFGALVGTGDAMTQFVFLQMAEPGRDLDRMASVVEGFDEANGPSQLFVAGGLALVVGAVLLAFGLWREGFGPAWTGVLLAAGVLANGVGFMIGSTPILVISSGMLLVGLGALALRGQRASVPETVASSL